MRVQRTLQPGECVISTVLNCELECDLDRAIELLTKLHSFHLISAPWNPMEQALPRGSAPDPVDRSPLVGITLTKLAWSSRRARVLDGHTVIRREATPEPVPFSLTSAHLYDMLAPF